jgi:hypothetical protein
MTEISRAAHLEWCKERAREYLAIGDTDNAWASMVSDLGKHPQTQGHSAIAFGMILKIGGGMNSIEETRSFIEGFN